ncbi:MAG: hypothetical protein JO372_02695 [Solirubrobacterales bacterium]|nr:hypothetical protein [Solirubrobacterales bacterium]
MSAQIKLDFNSSNGKGLLYTRTARASKPVRVGMDLLAFDAEGNSCTVTVVRVDGPIAYVLPDWSTWRDGPVTAVQAMVRDFEDVDAVVAGNGHGSPSPASGTNLVPEPALVGSA